MLAGFQQEGTFSPLDAVVVGGFDTVSRQIVLAAGQNLRRGSVLGKVRVGAVTVAPKAGGNTGNGVLTPNASPTLVNSRAGVYAVRFTSPTAFRVFEPSGAVLGDGALGATFADQIQFAVAAGATAFVAGDEFDVTVAPGAGKYVLSTTAAGDGSQNASAVLAEDTNASGGDATTVAYFKAVVDENALTFGAGQSPAACRDQLRAVGIDLQSSITR